MPKVSIIIPIYNAEKAVRRCIDSVLDQEYKDFELLLMDDGSKDGSPVILDEYAEKDERVRVVHKPNSGVSATRNMALDMAKGDWIQAVALSCLPFCAYPRVSVDHFSTPFMHLSYEPLFSFIIRALSDGCNTQEL